MSVKYSRDTLLHAAIAKAGGKVILGPKEIRDARSNKSCISIERLSTGVVELCSMGVGPVAKDDQPTAAERLQKALNEYWVENDSQALTETGKN